MMPQAITRLGILTGLHVQQLLVRRDITDKT